ncbi:hypothetical protein TanjilG_05014 [Lupinus angustifolius]|uniref:DIS3-like exonuclease 2 n=1 Tax=Lupinus angustifolius TaxID=3871 RepID=A0A4P1R593_LUPAN|nr:PREDICTED: DIS3-like exonuclease 2 [Lupinus angustifolius]OIW02421.1 hypothetical protein TanjilG_05014 [Lupinus angustifolius]
MRSAFEGSMSKRFDYEEKDTKKKRRSNRRSKQNHVPSTTASEVSKNNGLSLECSEKNGTPTHNTTAAALRSSTNQEGVDVTSLDEQGLSRSSDVAFVSMPQMHINEQVEYLGLQDSEVMQMHRGGTGSKSFSEPTVCRGSSGTNTNKKKESVPCGQIGHYGQRTYFSPHWSMDAVEKAIEKGDVFKAPFYVNAHNRLEAYCRIDGMAMDILINGFPVQNRAVEGDIVAVKIDPLSMWTKIKGPSVTCKNTAQPEVCNFITEDDKVADNFCNGKGKLDAEHESPHYRSSPGQNEEDVDHKSIPSRISHSPEKRYDYENNGLSNNFKPHGMTRLDTVDGLLCPAFDSLKISCCNEKSAVTNAVEELSLLANSFPSKRPTGRVVAIIERSARRDRIVGHLNSKNCSASTAISKKDSRKNKNMVSEQEYIQLIPTDPKLPNMTCFVNELPKCIKKRVKSGDVTIDMDLVAAQIDDWVEESFFPKAHILHIFGRGSEVQPQLDSILFQNAICLAEFAPEALSCLPCLPWDVPLMEIKSRIDLRNLCIFTIDPSTATDVDDALSIEKLPNGNYRVGIHIADVSYHVLPDTALDSEAQLRSTSVYMLQRKLPMLPPLLSENIGSLNPGVDRLAVSILLDMNHAGKVVDRWVGRSVIQSSCKLSYEHAQEIINRATGSNIVAKDYPKVYGRFELPDIITSVKSLYEISIVLKHKRFTDGALRLDNPKIVFLLDEYGIPYDSVFSEQKESNFLVEEFMLLANTTAAEIIFRAYPDCALLRRHPEPNMRKLRDFMAFCQKHGLTLKISSSGQIHCSLEQIREKLKGDPVLYDIVISYATRSMQLASYFCSGDLKDKDHECGHYSLAVPFYTHFTSPLRRYPDIVVHRTLLAVIEAEESYFKHQNALQVNKDVEVHKRCFTGINFDKNAAESMEGREALSAAALKHRIPCAEVLADVAAYCNQRKLASRYVKDACDKVYMWFLLKKKEVLLSEARVLGLGPKFMSIYIQRLAIERRIYYDEVEGLTVEWFEKTSTLVLSLSATNRRAFRRGGSNKWRAFDEVSLLTCPYNLEAAMDESIIDGELGSRSVNSEPKVNPAFFPLTVRILSTVPVALHAIGGDDGHPDIGVRLYMSSYIGEVDH